MAVPRFGRLAKRSYKSYGFCLKLTAVVILGLCFILVWFLFSPASYSVNSQRETFDDLAEPTSGNANPKIHSSVQSKREEHNDSGKGKKEKKVDSLEKKDNKNVNGSVIAKSGERHRTHKQVAKVKKRDDKLKIKKGTDKEELVQENEGSEKEDLDLDEEKQDDVKSEEEEIADGEGNGDDEVEGGSDLVSSLQMDQEDGDKEVDESEIGVSTTSRKNQKKLVSLFDPKAHYSWKSCSTRSKHNYIPCIDMESSIFKLHNYRHHERSCPKNPVMCLVPLPHNGYGTPIRWPESKLKILYKNVEHPKLAAFIKTQKWVMEAGKYLNFPQNQTALRGGIQHYLQSIEEMVPDIEWGKNIRVVLDIGSLDSSFGAALLEKNVLSLSLGLKDDLHDLAQLSLERGFPTIVSPFANRRLPFPSGVFDTIHCSECTISWHSNGFFQEASCC